MTNPKTIGERVRKLRLSQNVGQEEVATAIGISRSTLAGIETGIDRGGIETMIAVADYFKVPMDWLLGRRVPPGGPLIGKYINRPDQIAIQDFWDGLTIDEKNVAIKMLGIPEPSEAPAPTRRKASRR